ncbi:hypothetical protein CJ030_MR4G025852 [Morella rubra]|uniref:GDSL esterase/lipase n=1 Tax=Morella rubra TaxID=262757 RepID=A0A6A1VX80_9ROSI|nr:hypothetical protein CJ030_MR4G025852 [Morella rubra]
MAFNFFLLSFSFALFFIIKFTFSEAQMVPATFVFGDSLVDVGNNNYLTFSINKANFRPYGADFPTKIPTGRFSNGKNAADFIAEQVGLPTSPPYLSFESKKDQASFLTGVSFASGGAGIFAGNDERFRQSIPLIRQVDDFSQVHAELNQQLGSSGVEELLSKSLFHFVIGSNDILGYFGSSNLRKKSSPQDYVASMALELNDQLKRLHGYGARKFVIVGLAAIGCCPTIRKDFEGEECSEEINYWAAKYNDGLKTMLQNFKSELKDINYSYFDTYSISMNICGHQDTGATTDICQPPHCANRSDHLFWDAYHPTEAYARIIADDMFHEGPSKYTFPMNVRDLAAL